MMVPGAFISIGCDPPCTCRLGRMLQCTGAPEIAEPGFALRSGMTGTMIYWLSVNVLGLLTPREGAALIVTIFVAHVSHPACVRNMNPHHYSPLFLQADCAILRFLRCVDKLKLSPRRYGLSRVHFHTGYCSRLTAAPSGLHIPNRMCTAHNLISAHAWWTSFEVS